MAGQEFTLTPGSFVAPRWRSQRYSNCGGGGELKSIAAILERPVIERILTHLALDPQPPPRARAREAGLDFTA